MEKVGASAELTFSAEMLNTACALYMGTWFFLALKTKSTERMAAITMGTHNSFRKFLNTPESMWNRSISNSPPEFSSSGA